MNGSVEISDHLYLTVKAGSKPSFGKIMCKMEFSMAAVRKIFIEVPMDGTVGEEIYFTAPPPVSPTVSAAACLSQVLAERSLRIWSCDMRSPSSGSSKGVAVGPPPKKRLLKIGGALK